MTNAQIINSLQEIYPHQYPDETILMWIVELDKEIADYLEDNYWNPIYNQHDEDADIDLDTDTLIDEPSIYIEYLEYKVCMANNEFAIANNHAILFNSYFDAWKKRYFHVNRKDHKIPKYIRGLL